MITYREAYYSIFRDRMGRYWRVRVLRRSSSIIRSVGLTLAPEPISINWSETEITDVIQKSQATLNIVCANSSQLADLRSAKIGDVMLILDAGLSPTSYAPGEWQEMWRGTMDCETISEPLTRTQNYQASVTFSDFGIATRKKWSDKRQANVKVRNVLQRCLDQIGFKAFTPASSAPELVTHINTSIGKTSYTNIMDTFVCTDAFSTDDEPPSVAEVIERLLAPIHARIIQMNGKVYVYDTADLKAPQLIPVEWTALDAERSFDKSVGRISITLDQGRGGELVSPEVDESQIPNDFYTEYDGVSTESNPEGDTVTSFVQTAMSAANSPQSAYTPGAGMSAKLYYVKMSAMSGGSDATAIAYRFPYSGDGITRYGAIPGGLQFADITDIAPAGHYLHGQDAFKAGYIVSPDVFINECPTIVTTDLTPRGKKRMIRISLDMLFSPRTNPFEGGDDDKEKYKTFFTYTKFVYLPIRIWLVDESGEKILYEYYNDLKGNDLMTPGGGWHKYDADPESDYYDDNYHTSLMWYASNPSESSPFDTTSWVTNCPNRTRGSVTTPLLNKYKGFYIPCPEVRGYLRIAIGAHLRCSGYVNQPNAGEIWSDFSFSQIGGRWLCFNNLKIDIVDGYYKVINTDDIEETVSLNDENAEELSEKISFGTPSHYTPGLRAYYSAGDDPTAGAHYRAPSGYYADTIQALKKAWLQLQYKQPRLQLNGTIRDTAMYPDATYPQPYYREFYDAKADTRHTMLIGSMTFYPRRDESEVTLKEVIIQSEE